MLYAYRWQVELFFRCIKRTFNALHLWSHEANGLQIQFYIYLIAYVLSIHFKQTLIRQKKEEILSRQPYDQFLRTHAPNPLRTISIQGCRGVAWFLCWEQALNSYGKFLSTG